MRAIVSFSILAALCVAAQAQSVDGKNTFSQGGGAPPKDERETGQQLLEKLRASPAPAQQRDLNTLDLASAHRERAASVEEKTSGLWQSWLVSVCEGCGPDQAQFTDRSGSDYARKIRSQEAQQATAKPKYTYYYPTRATQSGRGSVMEANLSNENIDQIRRDPNR